MAKCNICSHYSGLWGDPGCSHAPYCIDLLPRLKPWDSNAYCTAGAST